jgi:hypothetical protein
VIKKEQISNKHQGASGSMGVIGEVIFAPDTVAKFLGMKSDGGKISQPKKSLYSTNAGNKELIGY